MLLELELELELEVAFRGAKNSNFEKSNQLQNSPNSSIGERQLRFNGFSSGLCQTPQMPIASCRQ